MDASGSDKVKKHVLIVDDEPGIARVYGLKIKLSGFEVSSATRGKEGIDLIRKNHPDLVLLDVLMPDITGFDVLEEVRKFSRIPIIVFSARPETNEIAIRLGANDTIAKPADPDMLVNKIKQVLFKHIE